MLKLSLIMEESELRALANSLHDQFGKRFHSTFEAMQLLRSIWEQDPLVSTAVLRNLAVSGAGKKKSHASVNLDSGKQVPYYGSHRKRH